MISRIEIAARVPFETLMRMVIASAPSRLSSLISVDQREGGVGVGWGKGWRGERDCGGVVVMVVVVVVVVCGGGG